MDQGFVSKNTGTVVSRLKYGTSRGYVFFSYIIPLDCSSLLIMSSVIFLDDFREPTNWSCPGIVPPIDFDKAGFTELREKAHDASSESFKSGFTLIQGLLTKLDDEDRSTFNSGRETQLRRMQQQIDSQSQLLLELQGKFDQLSASVIASCEHHIF